VTRSRWALGAAGLLVGAAIVGGVVISSSGGAADQADRSQRAQTARVERGPLSTKVNLSGILTYRARPDGSPYAAVNQASGIYTELPVAGAKINCGNVLYRVNEDPVLLLCGAIPAYRDLASGATGEDVRQLNRNLHDLGYDAAAGVEVDPTDSDFNWATQAALSKLQDDKGLDATGRLALDAAVFQPSSVRVSKVIGKLGGPARPGSEMALTTSDRLEVQVDLDALQQNQVRKGAPALITLPNNEMARGKIDRIGRVAQAPDTQGEAGAATIPAFISLEHPAEARRFERAPVQVEIATAGVKNALSVPDTALVGKSGGGFAVEVVRDDGQRDLVAVKLGLFDTTGGRVQVEGEIREGDRVVVPAS
jgi:peptidoglycan hydrolase-like protein with peptidoglycan-binding domain